VFKVNVGEVLPVVVRFAGADNGIGCGRLRRAKEDRNVLLAGRFHLPKFPDGRPGRYSSSSCGSGY